MYRSQVLICGGTGCTSSGSVKIAKRLQEEIDKNGLTDEVMARMQKSRENYIRPVHVL